MKIKVKVMVADDDPDQIIGLTRRLDSLNEFELVPPDVTESTKDMQPCKTLSETIERITQYKPDVVVMDISWNNEEMDGITAARIIKDNENLPRTGVILYTNHTTRENVERGVLEGKVDGFVAKATGDPSELPRAIRTVSKGKPYFTPDALVYLLDMVRGVGKHPSPQALSKEESDLLKRLARGESNTTIAQELNLTEPAIRTRCHDLYIRLDVYKNVDNGADELQGVIDPRWTAVLIGLEQGYLDFTDLVPYSVKFHK